MRNSLDTAKEEGIEEGVERVARNFLNNAIPIEVVIKSIGLTKEQIEKLKYMPHSTAL